MTKYSNITSMDTLLDEETGEITIFACNEDITAMRCNIELVNLDKALTSLNEELGNTEMLNVLGLDCNDKYWNEIKVCVECKEEKRVVEFHRNKNKKFGRSNMCKVCIRAYQQENSEAISENGKKWLEERPGYAKRWYQDHKERQKTSVRVYQQTHKPEVNAMQARRRAMKINATVSWSDPVKILELNKEVERLTKETGIQHHLDHIYPLQGKTCCGLHVETNLRAITEEENCSKGNKHPLDFYGEEKLKEILK